MTIQAGGETWHKSDHVRDNHPDVLDYHLAYVLDNWMVEGDRFSKRHQRWQRHYMSILPDDTEAGHMVRVVTETARVEESELKRIVTAFRDTMSRRHWSRGNIGYFTARYRDLEVRDA